jgi:TRAP-type C4-dicarboxylate transport system permease small subunit
VRHLLDKRNQGTEKAVYKISNMLSIVGMGMLLGLAVLDTVDVICRYFLSKPIVGTLEISEILLPGIVFFGWPYTQARKGHVAVRFVVDRFPLRAQVFVDLLSYLLMLIFLSLIVWRGIVTAISYWHSNRWIAVINVPIYPFQLFVSLGASVFCIVMFFQMCHLLTQIRKRN